MDSHNLLTPTTARLLRLEYLVALAVCSILGLMHWHGIRWPVFILLFAVIDVVGYLPGRIVWQRRHGGPVPRVYYLLYNTMHSMLTASLIAAAWCVFVRPEWALLALPIHLCGDRSIFGNFPKPFGLAFEPVTHPAYSEFRRNYDHANLDSRAASGASVEPLSPAH